MKELTIEQKARAYDEALERAMKLKENPQSVFNEYSPKEGDTICDYIFPELKESEDEKTRKEIINYLKKNCRLEWAAWLEKQSEYKLAWSEEDEQYLLVCKNALAKYQTTDKWDANIIYNWLKNKLQKL